jgi:acyl-CoA dehydrogenase
MGWSEEQLEFRASLRRFADSEIAPSRFELESGRQPPYEVLRRYYAEFQVGDEALARFQATMDDRSIPRANPAEILLPIIEFSRQGPGLVTSLGVSTSLAPTSILRAGNAEQKMRWVPDLLTFTSIGAWALTEPDSGSDAFGGMRSRATRVDGGYLLNGSKTFVTNGPYADTIVYFAKLANSDGVDKVTSFVLDGNIPGLSRSAPLDKMGLHSSPTGDLHLIDVFVEADRHLATNRGPRDRSSHTRARATFAAERASVAAMSLGVIERCLELSIEYARARIQFGDSIGTFQLVQEMLARIEMARYNVENMLLRYLQDVETGDRPTLAAASVMKLYAASAASQAASDAVQIHGGSGYMASSHVEQLFRDARVLQIYGGTDQMQILEVAKDLLRVPSVNR